MIHMLSTKDDFMEQSQQIPTNISTLFLDHKLKEIVLRLKPTTDILIATFCVVYIFWIPLFFYASGISIVSYLEESVGYRYFYSLRLAFGHEAIWLPQGQLVTLYHVLLQYLLTFFGLPNDQLFPRIDIFCILTLLLPMLLAWLAFLRLSLQFESKILVLFIYAVFIFMLDSLNLPGLPGGGRWTMMPDYHVWVIGLAVFSASLLPKFNQKVWHPSPKNMSWFFWMGILTGLAAGIKVTFMLFPLSVLVSWCLNGDNWQKMIGRLLLAGGSCIFTTGFILWANTGFGTLSDTLHFLAQSIYFCRTQSATMLGTELPSHLESLVPLILALFVLFTGTRRHIRSLSVLGVFGIIYTIFLYMRFYNHSFVEYHAFIIILLVPVINLYRNEIINIIHKHALSRIAFIFPIALVFIVTMQHAWSQLHDIPAHFLAMNQAAAAFHKNLLAGPTPTWILTTENSYRPNSIESAMCKGGMHIINPKWGDSPYLATLFPTFHCAVLSYELTDENRKEIIFSTIGFSHLRIESINEAVKRIEKTFNVSLKNLNCHDIKGNYDAPLTYCYPQPISTESQL